MAIARLATHAGVLKASQGTSARPKHAPTTAVDWEYATRENASVSMAGEEWIALQYPVQATAPTEARATPNQDCVRAPRDSLGLRAS